MTSFTISSNSNSARTLKSGETGTVSSGVALTTSGIAITWDTSGSTGTATITNNGTISSTGDRAIRGPASGSNTQSLLLQNNLGATITSSSADTIQLRAIPNGNLGTVTINNLGTISETGTGGSNGQALDLNDLAPSAAGKVHITNGSTTNSTATISAADSDAIRAGAFLLIDNYGTIQSAYAGTQSVANASASGNDGIDANTIASPGLQVNNFQGGQILGSQHGISSKGTNGNLNSVYNDGIITGSGGSGINFDTTSGTATITNDVHGVITGNASSTTDGDAIDIDNLVNITNHGTIRALGSVATLGTLNEALAIGGGSVVNDGTITSDQRAITVDDSNGAGAFGALNLNNSGTITGSNGTAITIIGTQADTITNSGTINGSVSTDDGNDSVTNSGTFNGALSTGAGNDTITLSGSGAPTSIDGGAGTSDKIVVNGSANVTIGSVSNVETLQVDAGSAKLSTAQSYSSGVTLGAASLEIAGAISATPSIALTGSGLASTLVLDSTAFSSGDFATKITGFGTEDKIDLKGFGLETSASLGANNVLTLSGGTGAATIHLDPSQSFSGERFHLASDGAGGTYLTHAANAAPVVANAIADQHSSEDAALSYQIPVNSFSDMDGDTLSYSATLGNGDPLPGWLTFTAATRTFSGTPPQDFNGALDLKVTASDGTLSASDSFTLTIDPVNDAPVVANAIADQHSSEDGAWSYQAPANSFSDVDGDTLSYSATLGNGDPLPGWLTFTAATRTFSGTPPQDFNGTIDLKVTASDGTLSASDSFTLTIDPVNDAPATENAIADQHSAEDAAWSYQVPANSFSDADGDTLSYAATLASGDPLPSWLTFTAATQTFSGTPPQDFNGTIDLTVTASDGTLSVSDSFTLTVDPVNDAPTVANAIADQHSTEDTAWSYQLPANSFSDADGDTLSYTATLGNGDPLPVWLHFDGATRTFSGTPPQDFNGTIDLKVTASDGTLSASDSFTLTIDPVNDAPALANAIADQHSPENAAWSYQLPANSFTDVDGDTLSYTATLGNGDPLPAWLHFDGATRTFSGTPPLDFHGVLDLAVNASDGSLSASDGFTLTIDQPGGASFTLTNRKDTVSSGAGDDRITATAGTLNATDNIDGGGGTDTLAITGAGTFNLKVPHTLANIEVIEVSEGQAAGGGIAASRQAITLRAGMTATVNVLSPAANPANPKPVGITIVGADDSATINLGAGTDTVTLGSANETVNGGTGVAAITSTAANAGALLHSGTGAMTLKITGGGTAVLNAADTGVKSVTLANATTAWDFTADDESGLVITDSSRTADTIRLGGAGQTVTGGAAGMLTMIASDEGGDTFRNRSALMNGDTIVNFTSADNVIDLTDMKYARLRSASFTQDSVDGGTLTLTDGAHTAAIHLMGQYMAVGNSGTAAQAGFTVAANDAATGTKITYAVPH